MQWDDIYGDSVMNAIAFSGGNYIHAPPTNMTATPKIKNITVQNVRLTNVEGAYQGISTLPESPIDGLFLRNISFTMTKVHRASWTCQAGCSGTTGCVNKIFASGLVENVSPPLPKECQFGSTLPPTPPAPAVHCAVTAVLGCYNDSTAAMATAAGWVDTGAQHKGDHDDVTHENCAALCFGQHRSVGGIDQGNHCRCGDNHSVAVSAASYTLPMTACQDKAWPCTGVCCGPNANSGCVHGACSGKPAEQCGGPGALLAYSFSCSPGEGER